MGKREFDRCIKSVFFVLILILSNIQLEAKDVSAATWDAGTLCSQPDAETDPSNVYTKPCGETSGFGYLDPDNGMRCSKYGAGTYTDGSSTITYGECPSSCVCKGEMPDPEHGYCCKKPGGGGEETKYKTCYGCNLNPNSPCADKVDGKDVNKYGTVVSEQVDDDIKCSSYSSATYSGVSVWYEKGDANTPFTQHIGTCCDGYCGDESLQKEEPVKEQCENYPGYECGKVDIKDKDKTCDKCKCVDKCGDGKVTGAEECDLDTDHQGSANNPKKCGYNEPANILPANSKKGWDCVNCKCVQPQIPVGCEDSISVLYIKQDKFFPDGAVTPKGPETPPVPPTPPLSGQAGSEIEATVQINELRIFSSLNPGGQFIEIYNPGKDFDASNLYLSDSSPSKVSVKSKFPLSPKEPGELNLPAYPGEPGLINEILPQEPSNPAEFVKLPSEPQVPGQLDAMPAEPNVPEEIVPTEPVSPGLITGSAVAESELTETVNNPEGKAYYKITTDKNFGGGDWGDFHARFPDGYVIPHGATVTIALWGSDAFYLSYGIVPDIELFEDDSYLPDDIPEMREVVVGSRDDYFGPILNNPAEGIVSDGESVYLYTWDGKSDKILDEDIVNYYSTSSAVDKTGVAIDGIDFGSAPTTYYPDTPVAEQTFVPFAEDLKEKITPKPDEKYLIPPSAPNKDLTVPQTQFTGNGMKFAESPFFAQASNNLNAPQEVPTPDVLSKQGVSIPKDKQPWEYVYELAGMPEKGETPEQVKKIMSVTSPELELFEKKLGLIQSTAEAEPQPAQETEPVPEEIWDYLGQDTNFEEAIELTQHPFNYFYVSDIIKSLPVVSIQRIRQCSYNPKESADTTALKNFISKFQLTSSEQVQQTTEPQQGVCFAEYAPVCGADGKTYSNLCYAKVAGVSVVQNGECTGGGITGIATPQTPTTPQKYQGNGRLETDQTGDEDLSQTFGVYTVPTPGDSCPPDGKTTEADIIDAFLDMIKAQQGNEETLPEEPNEPGLIGAAVAQPKPASPLSESDSSVNINSNINSIYQNIEVNYELAGKEIKNRKELFKFTQAFRDNTVTTFNNNMKSVKGDKVINDAERTTITGLLDEILKGADSKFAKIYSQEKNNNLKQMLAVFEQNKKLVDSINTNTNKINQMDSAALTTLFADVEKIAKEGKTSADDSKQKYTSAVENFQKSEQDREKGISSRPAMYRSPAEPPAKDVLPEDEYSLKDWKQLTDDGPADLIKELDTKISDLEKKANQLQTDFKNAETALDKLAKNYGFKNGIKDVQKLPLDDVAKLPQDLQDAYKKPADANSNLLKANEELAQAKRDREKLGSAKQFSDEAVKFSESAQKTYASIKKFIENNKKYFDEQAQKAKEDYKKLDDQIKDIDKQIKENSKQSDERKKQLNEQAKGDENKLGDLILKDAQYQGITADAVTLGKQKSDLEQKRDNPSVDPKKTILIMKAVDALAKSQVAFTDSYAVEIADYESLLVKYGIQINKIYFQSAEAWMPKIDTSKANCGRENPVQPLDKVDYPLTEEDYKKYLEKVEVKNREVMNQVQQFAILNLIFGGQNEKVNEAIKKLEENIKSIPKLAQEFEAFKKKLNDAYKNYQDITSKYNKDIDKQISEVEKLLSEEKDEVSKQVYEKTLELLKEKKKQIDDLRTKVEEIKKVYDDLRNRLQEAKKDIEVVDAFNQASYELRQKQAEAPEPYKQIYEEDINKLTAETNRYGGLVQAARVLLKEASSETQDTVNQLTPNDRLEYYLQRLSKYFVDVENSNTLEALMLQFMHEAEKNVDSALKNLIAKLKALAAENPNLNVPASHLARFAYQVYLEKIKQEEQSFKQLLIDKSSDYKGLITEMETRAKEMPAFSKFYNTYIDTFKKLRKEEGAKSFKVTSGGKIAYQVDDALKRTIDSDSINEQFTKLWLEYQSRKKKDQDTSDIVAKFNKELAPRIDDLRIRAYNAKDWAIVDGMTSLRGFYSADGMSKQAIAEDTESWYNLVLKQKTNAESTKDRVAELRLDSNAASSNVEKLQKELDELKAKTDVKTASKEELAQLASLETVLALAKRIADKKSQETSSLSYQVYALKQTIANNEKDAALIDGEILSFMSQNEIYSREEARQANPELFAKQDALQISINADKNKLSEINAKKLVVPDPVYLGFMDRTRRSAAARLFYEKQVAAETEMNKYSLDIKQRSEDLKKITWTYRDWWGFQRMQYDGKYDEYKGLTRAQAIERLQKDIAESKKMNGEKAKLVLNLITGQAVLLPEYADDYTKFIEARKKSYEAYYKKFLPIEISFDDSTLLVIAGKIPVIGIGKDVGMWAAGAGMTEYMDLKEIVLNEVLMYQAALDNIQVLKKMNKNPDLLQLTAILQVFVQRYEKSIRTLEQKKEEATIEYERHKESKHYFNLKNEIILLREQQRAFFVIMGKMINEYSDTKFLTGTDAQKKVAMDAWIEFLRIYEDARIYNAMEARDVMQDVYWPEQRIGFDTRVSSLFTTGVFRGIKTIYVGDYMEKQFNDEIRKTNMQQDALAQFRAAGYDIAKTRENIAQRVAEAPGLLIYSEKLYLNGKEILIQKKKSPEQYINERIDFLNSIKATEWLKSGYLSAEISPQFKSLDWYDEWVVTRLGNSVLSGEGVMTMYLMQGPINAGIGALGSAGKGTVSWLTTQGIISAKTAGTISVWSNRGLFVLGMPFEGSNYGQQAYMSAVLKYGQKLFGNGFVARLEAGTLSASEKAFFQVASSSGEVLFEFVVEEMFVNAVMSNAGDVSEAIAGLRGRGRIGTAMITLKSNNIDAKFLQTLDGNVIFVNNFEDLEKVKTVLEIDPLTINSIMEKGKAVGFDTVEGLKVVVANSETANEFARNAIIDESLGVTRNGFTIRYDLSPEADLNEMAEQIKSKIPTVNPDSVELFNGGIKAQQYIDTPNGVRLEDVYFVKPGTVLPEVSVVNRLELELARIQTAELNAIQTLLTDTGITKGDVLITNNGVIIQAFNAKGKDAKALVDALKGIQINGAPAFQFVVEKDGRVIIGDGPKTIVINTGTPVRVGDMVGSYLIVGAKSSIVRNARAFEVVNGVPGILPGDTVIHLEIDMPIEDFRNYVANTEGAELVEPAAVGITATENVPAVVYKNNGKLVIATAPGFEPISVNGATIKESPLAVQGITNQWLTVGKGDAVMTGDTGDRDLTQSQREKIDGLEARLAEPEKLTLEDRQDLVGYNGFVAQYVPNEGRAIKSVTNRQFNSKDNLEETVLALQNYMSLGKLNELGYGYGPGNELIKIQRGVANAIITEKYQGTGRRLGSEIFVDVLDNKIVVTGLKMSEASEFAQEFYSRVKSSFESAFKQGGPEDQAGLLAKMNEQGVFSDEYLQDIYNNLDQWAGSKVLGNEIATLKQQLKGTALEDAVDANSVKLIEDVFAQIDEDIRPFIAHSGMNEGRIPDPAGRVIGRLDKAYMNLVSAMNLPQTDASRTLKIQQAAAEYKAAADNAFEAVTKNPRDTRFFTRFGFPYGVQQVINGEIPSASFAQGDEHWIVWKNSNGELKGMHWDGDNFRAMDQKQGELNARPADDATFFEIHAKTKELVEANKDMDPAQLARLVQTRLGEDIKIQLQNTAAVQDYLAKYGYTQQQYVEIKNEAGEITGYEVPLKNFKVDESIKTATGRVQTGNIVTPGFTSAYVNLNGKINMQFFEDLTANAVEWLKGQERKGEVINAQDVIGEITIEEASNIFSTLVNEEITPATPKTPELRVAARSIVAAAVNNPELIQGKSLEDVLVAFKVSTSLTDNMELNKLYRFVQKNPAMARQLASERFQGPEAFPRLDARVEEAVDAVKEGENNKYKTQVLEKPAIGPQVADTTDIRHYDELAKRDYIDSKENLEKSLVAARDALLKDNLPEGVKIAVSETGAVENNGIVVLKNQEVPTIVIPDMHARRDMLLTILNQVDPASGKTNFELLKAGKLNIVSLGDGMHSEGRARDRWVEALGNEEAMNAEMVESMNMMKMVMDLKVAFPDSFHYVRGNHDDLIGQITLAKKYADEGYQVLQWMNKKFGPDFVGSYAAFEKSLPLMVKGNEFVASHAGPKDPFTLDAIQRKTAEALFGLTWTDNTAGKMPQSAVDSIMNQLGVGQWFIGHRPVGKQATDLKRIDGNGKVIQMNNPYYIVFAYVDANGNYNVFQIGGTFDVYPDFVANEDLFKAGGEDIIVKQTGVQVPAEFQDAADKFATYDTMLKALQAGVELQGYDQAVQNYVEAEAKLPSDYLDNPYKYLGIGNTKTTADLADQIESQVNEKGQVLVVIDGKPGTGKSTLADFLPTLLPRLKIQVIHTDVMRSPKGIAESYFKDGAQVVIVEGTYSFASDIKDLNMNTLRAVVQVDNEATRMDAIRKRYDLGAGANPEFLNDPTQRKAFLFEVDVNARSKADMIIDNTPIINEFVGKVPAGEIFSQQQLDAIGLKADTILAKVGSGSFADTYKAVLQNGETVAFKIQKPAALPYMMNLNANSFVIEPHTLDKLKDLSIAGTSVPKVIGTYTTPDNRKVIEMTYFKGKTLDILANQGLTREQFDEIFEQLDSLKNTMQLNGVYYFDWQTLNVLVETTSAGIKVHLVDFGLTLQSDPKNLDNSQFDSFKADVEKSVPPALTPQAQLAQKPFGLKVMLALLDNNLGYLDTRVEKPEAQKMNEVMQLANRLGSVQQNQAEFDNAFRQLKEKYPLGVVGKNLAAFRQPVLKLVAEGRINADALKEIDSAVLLLNQLLRTAPVVQVVQTTQTPLVEVKPNAFIEGATPQFFIANVVYTNIPAAEIVDAAYHPEKRIALLEKYKINIETFTVNAMGGVTPEVAINQVLSKYNAETIDAETAAIELAGLQGMQEQAETFSTRQDTNYDLFINKYKIGEVKPLLEALAKYETPLQGENFIYHQTYSSALGDIYASGGLKAQREVLAEVDSLVDNELQSARPDLYAQGFSRANSIFAQVDSNLVAATGRFDTDLVLKIKADNFDAIVANNEIIGEINLMFQRTGITEQEKLDIISQWAKMYWESAVPLSEFISKGYAPEYPGSFIYVTSTGEKINFPEVLIQGNVPNNLIQIEKYPPEIQALFDDLEVDTATEALNLLTPQISDEELKLRWNGQTELALPIGMTDEVTIGKVATTMNPENTIYGANGLPVTMKFKQGDKVRLKRGMFDLTPEQALQIAATKNADSYLLAKNNGNLEAAIEEFKTLRPGAPHEYTLEEILGYTWAHGWSLGIPATYAGTWGYVAPGNTRVTYSIEVPAENVILLDSNGNLPAGFDINRPDIDKFAFVDPMVAEGEITFIYSIPQEYIVRVEVGAPETVPVTGGAVAQLPATGSAIALPTALDEKYVVNILFTADELKAELRARGFTDKEIDVLVDEWYKSLLIEAAKDSDSPLVEWMIQTSPQLTTEELINKIRENYGAYSGNSPLLGFVLGQPEHAESAS